MSDNAHTGPTMFYIPLVMSASGLYTDYRYLCTIATTGQWQSQEEIVCHRLWHKWFVHKLWHKWFVHRLLLPPTCSTVFTHTPQYYQQWDVVVVGILYLLLVPLVCPWII